MSSEKSPRASDAHGGEAARFHPKGEARRKERGYHPISRGGEADTPLADPTEPDRTTLGAQGTRPDPEPGTAGAGSHRKPGR